MNIAILGTGFGAYHAGLLTKMEAVDRVTVFGRNTDKLHKLKEELNVAITTSIDDIMSDSAIDIVDICLPSNLHRQFAIQALQAGKHVFCETPVCWDKEDGESMLKAEIQSGKRILVNQFIKFDSAYRYLYEAAQTKKYGRLLKLTLRRETAPLWGDLGFDAISTNLMIHELDFINWLLPEFTLTSVWGSSNGDKPQQAMVQASFNTANQMVEIITSSQMPDNYPFTVGYEAYFEQGKLVYHESEDNQGNSDSALYEFGVLGKHLIVLDKDNSYEKSLQYALHSFQCGSGSTLSLEQALRSLDIAIEVKHKLTNAYIG